MHLHYRDFARRHTLRLVVLIVVVAMLAATLITVAFGNNDSPTPGVVIEWLHGDDSASPTPAPTLPGLVTGISTPAPQPTLRPDETPAVSGFSWPVAGACLPASDDLMPGAPRPYRNGIHEGVDFYDSDNCTPMGEDTEILAAKGGTVIRADVGYQELTPDELATLEERVANGEANDPDLIDAFRGRQVWVDHGNGIVTRYCHLEGVEDGIEAGERVEAGDVVGYMGQSGEPESVTAPGTQVHLHFEIRDGDGYLGQGLPPDEVRALYEAAFAP